MTPLITPRGCTIGTVACGCRSAGSYLCISDGGLIRGPELPGALFILPEVSLAANQNDWSVPTEVSHLWEPLGKKGNAPSVLLGDGIYADYRPVRVVFMCAFQCFTEFLMHLIAFFFQKKTSALDFHA